MQSLDWVSSCCLIQRFFYKGITKEVPNPFQDIRKFSFEVSRGKEATLKILSAVGHDHSCDPCKECLTLMSASVPLLKLGVVLIPNLRPSHRLLSNG